MPTYTYTGYRNPYVQSISDLIQEPGRIEANKAVAVANAQAQAQQAQGQIWGQAASQIGQQVAQTAQMQLDPRRQLEAAQLAEMKRVQAGRQVLAQAIKANTDQQGATNHERVAQLVSSAGFPDQAESWLKMSSNNAESLAKLRDITQKYRNEQTAAIGDLAFHANSAEDFNSALGLAAANGIIDEQTAHQAAAQADAVGADAWKNAKARLQQFSPAWKKQQEELSKPQKLGEGEQVVVPATGQVVAKGAPKPVVVPEGATVIDPASGAILGAGGPKALDEFQTFKQSYPKTLGKTDWNSLSPKEQRDALGVYAESKADPAIRAAALAQKNLATALAQLQLSQMPTAEQAASVADDVVHHRLGPEQLATLFSTRGKEGMQFKLAVATEAKKLDPTFNWEQASAEYQLSKSPNFQNTVRYIDTVVESIPRLNETAKKLANGQFKSINDLANAAKGQFNDTDLKAFKTDAVLVGDEIAKILQGGGTGNGVSDGKLKQAQELMSTSDSVPAIAAAIKEVQFLIANRRASLTRGTYLEGTAPKGSGETPPATSGFSNIKRTPVK
jgi:hypothetical protein